MVAVSWHTAKNLKELGEGKINGNKELAKNLKELGRSG